MLRPFAFSILGTTLALVTSINASASSGNLCSGIFAPTSKSTLGPSAFAKTLKSQLEERLLPLDTQLASFTYGFEHNRGAARFSASTVRQLVNASTKLRESGISPVTFAAYENKLDRIFSKDVYAQTLTARYKSTIGAKSFENSLREQFADLIRSGYAVDVALVELQFRVDKQLSPDAAYYAVRVSKIAEILHLVRHSSVYRFLGSTDNNSYFWRSLENVEMIKAYRRNLLAQVRNRHQSKMSPQVIERLRLLQKQGDADIETVAAYAKFLSLSRSLSPKAPLAVLPAYEVEFERIRKRLGATEGTTPGQLNQALNRLSRNEPYEMTLAVLFEDGAGKDQLLRNLSNMSDVLDLATALESSAAFGHYARQLAEAKEIEKEQLAQSLKP